VSAFLAASVAFAAATAAAVAYELTVFAAVANAFLAATRLALSDSLHEGSGFVVSASA
jgi:hypothetical protein